MGGVLGLILLHSSQAPVNVFGCAFVLAGLALDRPERERAPWLGAAWSVTIFALYRFALFAIPWVWLAADRLGLALSGLAGAIGPGALWTGATFGGVDFLVLTVALFGCWLRGLPGSRWAAGLRFGAIVAVGHLLYLVVVATYPQWSVALAAPAPASPAEAKAAAQGAQKLGEMILWNLPAMGALIHLAMAGYLLRGICLSGEVVARTELRAKGGYQAYVRGRLGAAVVMVLAAAVPLLATLNLKLLTLRGKKIVAYEKGFLNWLKPKHGDYGRLSIGMYGMLPEFLESYGARCLISPELSESDLRDADLLLLIFPNEPWGEGQLERVHRFVREGGTLVVLGEHTVRDKDGGNRFNEVLEPTALRVAFDSAMFAIGGWLDSYEVLAHPAGAGLADDRNQLGVVIGASVEAGWAARPVLVGRWGWADPGDAANDESRGGSMMGNQRYDPGEKLGDILLAAEQSLGRGRVVVFGDTSGFTNGILFGSHVYVARLLASLCQRAWFGPIRSGAALLGLVFLGVFFWSRREPVAVWMSALLFAASLTLATVWNERTAALYPDGARRAPNSLAYIDTTHLERSSGESWRLNGLGGLEMTLMRNGYLVLGLPEFTSERLQGAGLLVSVAPGRPFSRREVRVLRRFIEEGGTFICTVGYPESAASRPMLAELGFHVGGEGAATGGGPEPKPFGHFKAPYYNGGDYMAYVRFHAAWPVESTDPRAQPLAYGPRDPGRPGQQDPTVILLRRIGRGKAMVVADSDFATNQNLEREGGEPFEGMRENADFWRWLISYLNEQPTWIPPKPIIPTPAETNAPPADPSAP